MDDLGAVWMRNTFQWSDIQTSSKRWNFRKYDAYVARGKKADKKILAVLAYDVGWIYGEKEEARRHIIPEKIPYFLQYVEAVVKRYKGRVDAFEIWNEPNWSFWKGSEEDFIALTKATVDRIKKVDPSAKVVAGAFWRVPEGFLRKMWKAGALDRVDAVSFHPYALSPEGVASQYEELKKLLAEFGFKGEIWVTEIGFPSRGWYLTSVDEEEMPQAVLKTLAALSSRGVRRIFWYELFDKFTKAKASSKTDSELYFGLAYPDYRKKTGALAYSLFAKGTAGSEYRPDLIVRSGGSDEGLEAFLYRKGDGTGVLLLFREGRGTRSVRLSSEGSARRVDIVTGSRVPLGRGESLDVSRTPTFLEFSGLGPGSVITIEMP